MFICCLRVPTLPLLPSHTTNEGEVRDKSRDVFNTNSLWWSLSSPKMGLFLFFSSFSWTGGARELSMYPISKGSSQSIVIRREPFLPPPTPFYKIKKEIIKKVWSPGSLNEKYFYFEYLWFWNELWDTSSWFTCQIIVSLERICDMLNEKEWFQLIVGWIDPLKRLFVLIEWIENASNWLLMA